jgi:hypothetical protein
MPAPAAVDAIIHRLRPAGVLQQKLTARRGVAIARRANGARGNVKAECRTCFGHLRHELITSRRIMAGCKCHARRWRAHPADRFLSTGLRGVGYVSGGIGATVTVSAGIAASIPTRGITPNVHNVARQDFFLHR